MNRHLVLIPFCTGVLAAAGPCLASSTIELRSTTSAGTVEVRFSDLPPTGVAGYQVFLEYDPTRVSFVSGEYVSANFGLPFISPIAAANNRVSLAAGINGAFGQPPTSADQVVATLHFSFVGTGCDPRVRFRADAAPPTRLTDAVGEPISSLVLLSAWSNCNADFDLNGQLNVSDIFDFLSAWFAQSCRADFNNTGGLGVSDIFDFLNSWFSGC